MDYKKPYIPPRLIQYGIDRIPGWARQPFKNHFVAAVPETPRVAPLYTTVVDSEGRYVRVSDSFCELLGYRNEELIGKKFGELTAPKTNDIPTVFSLFNKLGYMHGLWMLVDRTGERILIRYESWLRTDSFIESNMEVVEHLR